MKRKPKKRKPDCSVSLVHVGHGQEHTDFIFVLAAGEQPWKYTDLVLWGIGLITPSADGKTFAPTDEEKLGVPWGEAPEGKPYRLSTKIRGIKIRPESPEQSVLFSMFGYV